MWSHTYWVWVTAILIICCSQNKETSFILTLATCWDETQSCSLHQWDWARRWLCLCQSFLVCFPTAFGHSPTHSLSHSRWILWVKSSPSSENTATMLFLLSDGTNVLTENTKNLLLFNHKSIKMLQNFQCARVRACTVTADISSCVWTSLCNGVSKAQSNSHNSNAQSCVCTYTSRVFVPRAVCSMFYLSASVSYIWHTHLTTPIYHFWSALYIGFFERKRLFCAYWLIYLPLFQFGQSIPQFVLTHAWLTHSQVYLIPVLSLTRQCRRLSHIFCSLLSWLIFLPFFLFLPPLSLSLKVKDKFRLEMSEEQAVQYLQNLIDDSIKAVFPELFERIHKLAMVRV